MIGASLRSKNRGQRGRRKGEGSIKAVRPLHLHNLDDSALPSRDRVKRKPALRGRNRAEG